MTAPNPSMDNLSDHAPTPPEVNRDHEENTIAKSMSRLKVFMQIDDDDPDRSFSEDVNSPTTTSLWKDAGRLGNRIRDWNNNG